MNITKNLFDEILYYYQEGYPESGGILGGSSNCINTVCYDIGLNRNPEDGCYIPNVKYLNYCLTDWKMRNITFYGIFHTHLPNWRTLSKSDAVYIKQIMMNMPQTIHKLYFPLVFPQEKILLFRAERLDTDITIVSDHFNIIGK